MSRAEYIIWRFETEEQIQEEHPGWNEDQVKSYTNGVEKKLREIGLLKVEE